MLIDGEWNEWVTRSLGTWNSILSMTFYFFPKNLSDNTKHICMYMILFAKNVQLFWLYTCFLGSKCFMKSKLLSFILKGGNPVVVWEETVHCSVSLNQSPVYENNSFSVLHSRYWRLETWCVKFFNFNVTKSANFISDWTVIS